MPDSKDRSRSHLHVEIRRDQFEALEELLPWGTKKKVFEVVVDQLIRLLQGPNGRYALGALLDDSIDVTERYNGTELQELQRDRDTSTSSSGQD